MTKNIRDYNSIKWDRYFYYDESSPSCLRWKNGTNSGRKKPHDVAGSKVFQTHSKKPYAWFVGRINGQMWAVHRIIYWLINGDFDNTLYVDHIDRNPFNNTISNLRLLSQADNSRNISKRETKETPMGVRQVSQSSYQAYFTEDNKLVVKYFHVKDYGTMENALLAAIAYREDAISRLRENGIFYDINHGK